MSTLLDPATVAPQQTPAQRPAAEIALLRKQGVYCLAGVVAGFVALATYVYQIDSRPKPAADHFVIYQNDKGETIKLDKSDGWYCVIQDGIEVGSLFGGEYKNNLVPKVYSWGQWPEGGKATVKLAHSNRTLHCTLEIEDMPPGLQQMTRSYKFGDWLYRGEFRSRSGVGVCQVHFFASDFSSKMESGKVVFLCDLTQKLSPVSYLEIESATISVVNYVPQQPVGKAK